MNNIKLIKKIGALVLVCCMALALFTACGDGDTVMSLTMEGNTYTINEDEFSLIMTIKKLDYCTSLYMPRYLDTEETWNTETEEGSGETLEQFYMNKVLEQTEAILVEKYLFDKYDLEISDETLKKLKDAKKQAITYLGGAGAFKQYYGYTADRYYDIYEVMVARSTAVLEHLMGENGSMKVTDDDLLTFYKENYTGYQYIMLDMKNKVKLDEEGNRIVKKTTETVEGDDHNDEQHTHEVETDSYETEALTDDEKSAKQTLADTILLELKEGTSTFEDLVQKYSDDYYSVNYPEGLFVLEGNTFLYDAVDKKAKELEIGEYTTEAISVNSDAYKFIVKRVELKDAVYNDEHYADLFEGYGDTVKYDKYETHIKSFFESVTIDQAVAGRYTIADTFLSEYADYVFQQYYYNSLGKT